MTAWSAEDAALNMFRDYQSTTNIDDAMATLARHLQAAHDSNRPAPSAGSVEAVALAIGDTPLLMSWCLRDLLCTTIYANDHVIGRLLEDAARAAMAATPAALGDVPREEREAVRAICAAILRARSAS